MLRAKTYLDSHGHACQDCPLHVDMSIGNEVIRTNVVVKYLEISLYLRLTFSYQIQYSANKAQKIFEQLSRLMVNIGGPLPKRQRLYIYGSEIWNETLEVKKQGKQKTNALHIASANRTVSAPAVLVIAGTIPVDLLAA